MDDYRNSPTIKFCADLFPAHRCPSVLKPLDDPTRLLLRCCRWSLGHRSSDVKSSTARISSHLSNRALLCLQPASAVAVACLNSEQRMNKISPKPCHKKCGSANLRVCKSASLQVCWSAGLQVCSLRLSHTANMADRKPTETSVTEFCYKSVNLFVEELINIKVILFLTHKLFR